MPNRPAAGETGPEIRMFSARKYEQESFRAANEAHGFHLVPVETQLNADTVEYAHGAPVISAFVNDVVDATVIDALAEQGTRCIAMRCAGFNNVDIGRATDLGIRVVRVPAYSPNAVAEHTLALILALNRSIHRASNRVRDGNFSLEGLVGFDVAGKTAGVVGTGRIGGIVARLLWHLRCRVLAVDVYQDSHLLSLGVEYVDLDRLLAESDLISLNCPLTHETHHMVNRESIAAMKPGVMIVNTGRGPLIDTAAAVEGLKSGQIGSLAMDVYEEEAPLFFEDRSGEIIEDDVFARLLTFPNVLITAHQAFLTHEALGAIAVTTLDNVATVLAGDPCDNEVVASG